MESFENTKRITLKPFKTWLFVQDDFVGDTNIWSFIEMAVFERNVTYHDGLAYSQVIFAFDFVRKPFTFILNVIFPCFCLQILFCSVVFIPPEDTNRSMFGITVVLSFMVLQTNIFDLIPKSAHIAYIEVFMSCQLVTSVVGTVYNLIASELAKKTYFNTRINFRGSKFRYIRIGDLVFYLNFVCIVIFIDAALFAMMIS